MEPQTWWNYNAEKSLDIFKDWVGDSNAESKLYMANYLKDKSYKSLVDAGCGNATFYDTLVHNQLDIKYIGVDSCKYFINLNIDRGLNMIESDIRNITVPDSSIDIVFSRHTFEHQPTFRDILGELIRVAIKEITHIFFIKPSDTEDIKYSHEDNLYHNCYSKTDIS